jgi:anti-sigma regulatory factor (Ser/Thr protein kinase)
MMFYRNPADEVYQMTLMGLRILPLCMPLAVISLNFSCYSQATEKKFLSLALPVLDGAVGVVLCSLVLIPAMKMTGLYIANVLNGVLCFMLIFGYAFHVKGKCPRTMEDLLAVPDSFGAAPNDRIDIEVRSMQEVLNISNQIIGFCTDCGIDRRRANHAALAMEEMAGNIILHGFTKDTKKHFVDIRVVHKENDLILRLRDNCKAFDPLSRAEMIQSEDLVSHIGLRMVRNISKDMQYQNLLGLNVLTIRL